MATRKRVIGFLAALTAAVSMATSALAQDVTLKLHQFLPAQANVPKLILDVWADNIERDSAGRIKIDRYPSMQLGGAPPELMDQAVDGVADVIWTVVGYTPGRFPRTEVLELPFLVSDPVAASHAYWMLHERHLKQTEFKDVEVLGTWVHGPGVIHSSEPIETPADMAGVKTRGASRMVNAMLGELGATPVGMPVPAVPEALSKGVVDAVTIPWEVTGSLKVPELVENHTEFEGEMLYTLTFVLAMNKERYDGLPDDLKAIVDKNSGLDFSVFAARVQADADQPAREDAIDLGNNIITVADSSAWKAVVEPLYAQWVVDMNEKGIDGQALIDELRELMADYSATKGQ